MILIVAEVSDLHREEERVGDLGVSDLWFKSEKSQILAMQLE